MAGHSCPRVTASLGPGEASFPLMGRKSHLERVAERAGAPLSTSGEDWFPLLGPKSHLDLVAGHLAGRSGLRVTRLPRASGEGWFPLLGPKSHLDLVAGHSRPRVTAYLGPG